MVNRNREPTGNVNMERSAEICRLAVARSTLQVDPNILKTAIASVASSPQPLQPRPQLLQLQRLAQQQQQQLLQQQRLEQQQHHQLISSPGISCTPITTNALGSVAELPGNTTGTQVQLMQVPVSAAARGQHPLIKGLVSVGVGSSSTPGGIQGPVLVSTGSAGLKPLVTSMVAVGKQQQVVQQQSQARPILAAASPTVVGAGVVQKPQQQHQIRLRMPNIVQQQHSISATGATVTPLYLSNIRPLQTTVSISPLASIQQQRQQPVEVFRVPSASGSAQIPVAPGTVIVEASGIAGGGSTTHHYPAGIPDITSSTIAGSGVQQDILVSKTTILALASPVGMNQTMS